MPGAEDSTGSYLAELDTGEGELCDTEGGGGEIYEEEEVTEEEREGCGAGLAGRRAVVRRPVTPWSDILHELTRTPSPKNTSAFLSPPIDNMATPNWYMQRILVTY